MADIFHQKRVLFLGNSITQNGTYVSAIAYLLHRKYPDIELDFVSIGLASETVSCLTENDHPFPRPCLRERLERALERVKPDLTIACYGMNDGIYHPSDPGRTAAFQLGIQDLRDKVKAVGSNLILITPPPFDALAVRDKVVGADAPDFSYRSPFRDYDQVLAQYSSWLLHMADADLRVIDWHGPLNDYVRESRKSDPDFSLAADGIHPSGDGHLLMARIFLEQLGMTFPEAQSLDWVSVSQDSFFQVVHEQRQQRSAHWLPYVGYIRGDTVQSLAPRPLLILMAGQSNMVGSGKRSELPEMAPTPSIRFVDFGLQALPRNDSMRFGPEVGLAQVLNRTFPHQQFILLKYAVGGSSLLDWSPDYSREKAAITGNERFGNMYADFFQKIDSIRTADGPEIAALLWMQGERDARIPEAGKDYYTNFQGFLEAFRTRIDRPELPVIFGLVNPPPAYYPAVETVVAAQRQVAAELDRVDFIETADLSKWEDDLHYSTQGQLELGRRFGRQLLEYIDPGLE